MNKRIRFSLALTATLIAMAVTFSITMVVSQNMFNNTVSSVKNKERMYNKLSEIDRYIRANEYFEINDDTLNDMIASGYVLGISDRYARYYSAKAYAEQQSVANGTLMGIGVQVVKDASSGYARVLRVYDNSPADEVGLQVGSYLTAIDDVQVKNLSDTAAVNSALLGEEGTTKTISVLTPNRGTTNFTVVHSGYTVTTVDSQLLEGRVGYVKIRAFSAGTALEVKSAVDGLNAQGATSFLFDLRDNTGENLNAALVAADYCVPEGTIAQSLSRDGKTETLRLSDDNAIAANKAILVNGSTAQSAELFALALKQMGGAMIVGTNTAGRGVLLSDPQSLSDGSAVMITVGMLLDSNGESWNGIGIAPDVEAELSVDEQAAYYDFTPDTDPQITKALTALAARN